MPHLNPALREPPTLKWATWSPQAREATICHTPTAYDASSQDSSGRPGHLQAREADASSFEAFRAHRRHVEVARVMAEISDWWVGDYLD